jgi:hypothetical protein
MGFWLDVICAPYSIPIGIINYKLKTLDMCSESDPHKIEINASTSGDVSYSGSLGPSNTPDLTSSSDYSILNQAIQNILSDASNKETRAVSTETTFTGSCPPVIPLKDDPDAEYTRWLKNKGEKKMGNDGKMYELQMFRCCPSIDQSSNITIVTFEKITEDDYESIYNELELYVTNTLTTIGGGATNDLDISVISGMQIKSVIKQNIKNQIENQTNQNVNVDLTMEYTDRYGRCEYDFDENNNLIVETTSCGNGLCGGRSKVIKQTVDIEILTKNIINSSMTIILDTDTNVKSETTVTVNRVTNYRVIVVSILWNVVVMFILSKLIPMLISKFISKFM